MGSETWFITKGSDSGVTKLAGDAMEGCIHKNTAVIGITLWENIHGRKEFIQAKDSIKIPKYLIKRDANGLPPKGKSLEYLNKEHTHFFFLDTGGNNSINKEAQFRSKLINHIIERQINEIEGLSFAKLH